MADPGDRLQRALAAARSSRLERALATAQPTAQQQQLGTAYFGTSDLLSAMDQPGPSSFFQNQPQPETQPFGQPEGQPESPAQSRGVRVALGAEQPRLSERIAPESQGIAGTLGDMAEDVENVARGLPSGVVKGLGGAAAEGLGAQAFLPQNLPGTLSRLVLGQDVPELQAGQLGRAGTEQAAEAVRQVTQPEGTAGGVGEFAGAIGSQLAAGRALAALREIAAARETGPERAELLRRMAEAPEAGQVFRANRLATVQDRAEQARQANEAAGQGIGKLAQTERRLAVENEPPSETSQLLRQADQELLAPNVARETRRAELAAEEAAAEADPLRQAMRATRARPKAPVSEPVPAPAPTSAASISPADGRLANLRKILGERGSISPGTVGTLAGAGTGAATGAAVDKEHPIRGAIIGGIAGAGLGAAAGKAIGRKGATAIEPEVASSTPARTVEQEVEDLLNSVKPAAERVQRASSEMPIPQGPARPDVDEFANVTKFGLADASGENRLRQEVSRVIEAKGLSPKQKVTWEETKQQAAKLGLNPDALSKTKAEKLTGPKLLAIRNIVSDNIDAMERLGKELAEGGSLTPAERALKEARMNALDSQNIALLDKFTAARTQAGRDLNNLKIVAMRSNDPVAWLARAQQWAGRPLELSERELVMQLAREGRVQDYLQLMGQLRKSGTLEKVGTFFKANLLTNPLTHVVNTTSNMSLAALETAKDVPGSVFDRLLSLATKRRTLAAPGLAQAKASMQGVRTGLAEAKQVLKGIPLEEAIQKWDLPRNTNFGNGLGGKVLNAYTQTVFRSLGAADRIFYNFALKGSLANQAKAAGMDVAAVLANPPEEMAIQAITDALQATVQDKTMVGDVLRSISKAGGGAGQFVVPFTRTPGAVATRTAEYTPIGGIEGVAKLVKAAMRKTETGRAGLSGITPSEQREVAKLMGRSATGSSLIALGYFLARKGIVSGTTDRQARSERDTHYLTGRPDNAIKVGKTWLSLSRMSPAGILLAVGANLHDIADAGADPATAAAGMVGTVAQAVTDQPFLTGLSNAIETARNPKQAIEQGGSRLLEDAATGFIPASAGLGALARGTDPYIRDQTGLAERIKGRLPGQSEQLPAMLDQFGEPVKREGGLVDAMLNPLRRTTDQTDDPVKAEIARLGVSVSRRRPSGNRDRVETRELVELEGPVLHRKLAQLIADPRYQAMSDDDKRLRIRAWITHYRAEATRYQKAQQAAR